MDVGKEHRCIVIAIFFSPIPKNPAYRGMDPLSSLNSFHPTMSSIDDDTFMAPDLSLVLDDTLSSVSLSLNTTLHNTLMSPGDFSHASRSLSSILGGSIYESGKESGAYTGNLQDRCRQLEWALSKERGDHVKLRKVLYSRILQHNN